MLMWLVLGVGEKYSCRSKSPAVVKPNGSNEKARGSEHEMTLCSPCTGTDMHAQNNTHARIPSSNAVLSFSKLACDAGFR